MIFSFWGWTAEFPDETYLGKSHWELAALIVESCSEITFCHWPFQEPKLEVPTIYIGPIFHAYYVSEYPRKYGLIWYSTSILGSWNSHWPMLKHMDFPVSRTTNRRMLYSRWSEVSQASSRHPVVCRGRVASSMIRFWGYPKTAGLSNQNEDLMGILYGI